MNPASPAEGPRVRAWIVAAFATIYLVWGSTFLAIRIGVQQLPPLLFGGLRFLLAGTLLAAVALAPRERFPRRQVEWRCCCGRAARYRSGTSAGNG